MIDNRYLVLVFLLLIGSSCGSKNTTQLTENEMSQVVLDITAADEIMRLHPPDQRDSVRELLIQSLLKIHNLDRAALDTNLYLYTSDFERFARTIDLTTEEALDRLDKAQKK